MQDNTQDSTPFPNRNDHENVLSAVNKIRQRLECSEDRTWHKVTKSHNNKEIMTAESDVYKRTFSKVLHL